MKRAAKHIIKAKAALSSSLQVRVSRPIFSSLADADPGTEFQARMDELVSLCE